LAGSSARPKRKQAYHKGMQAKRRILTFLAVAVAALLAATAFAQDQNTPEAKARRAMIGKTAPDLAVDHWLNSDGKALSLSGLRGKVVVLDFFTYW